MGAVAVAVIIRKEKDLVAHFRNARALTASSALSAAALGVEPGIAWHRLVKRAVIREAAPGTFFLDEPSWVALRGIRRRLLSIMLLLVVLALVTVVMTRR